MTIQDFCENLDLEKLNLDENLKEIPKISPEKNLYIKEVEYFTFRDYSYPFDECTGGLEKRYHIIPHFEKLIFVNEPDIFKKSGIDKLIERVKVTSNLFRMYTFCVSVREYPEKICIATYTGEDTLSFTRILYIFDSVEDTIKCLTQEIQKYESKRRLDEQEVLDRDDYMSNCLKNHGACGVIIPHATKKEKQILEVLANNYYRYLPESLYDRLVNLFGEMRTGLNELPFSHKTYTFADLIKTAYFGIK